jgi:hypothetical protein
MDRRAVKTLTDTYWSPQGWREPPSTPSKDDLEHAKHAGVMFDGPTREHHDAVVAAALAARDAVDEHEALDAFLSSLTSRRLELRSALGSLAVVRHLEEHAFDDDHGRCRICGLWEYEDIDRNVMSFERIRWGGVRRDDLVYVAFDLERFAAGEHPEATDDDRALLDALLDDLEQNTLRPRPPRRRRPRSVSATSRATRTSAASCSTSSASARCSRPTSTAATAIASSSSPTASCPTTAGSSGCTPSAGGRLRTA